MESEILRIDGLVKWYSKKSGVYPRKVTNLRAVDGVTLSVRRGETLGVVGESGCGKTTLARTVMRLTRPTSGSIFFEGADIASLDGRSLRPYRRKMQMVFQDPYASLDPRQNVRSAITEPIAIHRLAGRTEANRMAADLVSEVGLNADHLSRFPHEFSGGQRQRIALAIALAVRPDFMVLDEPTSSLDVSVQAQMLSLLRKLQKGRALTYMFISHNLAVIREVSDRVAVMYLGRVVEIAPTGRLFSNPKHPYTMALLSSIPIPDPAKRKELLPLSGDVPSPVDLPSGCRFRTRCAYATEKCAALSPPLVEVEKDHWVECLYDIDAASSNAVELGAAAGPERALKPT
ncbi:MAG TPA: ABC transporter ATP-binding protein [Nitrososphaerales archaeon]|nr:ABC transporter ATP-binding protein [Nitrososphaerales archaeon]